MRPAAQLLLVESGALPDVLARAPREAFDRPTVCAGWSVRDVLAHCGAALRRLVDDDLGAFSPEENQRDVDRRASWAVDRVVEELVGAYREAAEVMERLQGAADALGLGEWVHGGDVRDALGEPDAYASAGVELALPLIGARSVQRGAPAVEVLVDGVPVPFGAGEPTGRLVTDAATFVRLVGGRRPDPRRYELHGPVAAGQLVLYG